MHSDTFPGGVCDPGWDWAVLPDYQKTKDMIANAQSQFSTLHISTHLTLTGNAVIISTSQVRSGQHVTKQQAPQRGISTLLLQFPSRRYRRTPVAKPREPTGIED